MPTRPAKARARARRSTCRCRAARTSPPICPRSTPRWPRVAGFAPDLLVVSYGADTFAGDPISHFRLETRDYEVLGRRIAGLGLPSLVVMEGGYAVDALGANVASFLEGLADPAQLVIASEAKKSSRAEEPLDCFVATLLA